MDSSVCCSKLSSLLRSPFVMRDVILCCCRLRKSALHVEWKGLISLALSALSLPLWLGLITSVISLYGRRAEGMGDSRHLLEQLYLASALLCHS